MLLLKRRFQIGGGKVTNFWNNKKILLTGGAGFLGSFIIEKLISRGVKRKNLVIPRRSTMDLRLWVNCVKAVKNVDIVIHLAANVGGIGYNRKYPGTLFYDNAIMGIQLMEAARQSAIEKFISVGTVCAYPKYTKIPFKEEDLWKGYPEETNAPYGLAKKMLLVQSQAYRQQYNFRSIYLMPVNLYGPRDNFCRDSSHVIPALIRKCIEAKRSNADHITVWGSGKATREFLYVEDAAEGILLAAELYNGSEPVNLGSGMEISIYDLVYLIAQITSYKGRIIWDTTKPDGQPRRCLDTSKAEKLFGFHAKMSFEEGISRTIKWYSIHSINQNSDSI